MKTLIAIICLLLTGFMGRAQDTAFHRHCVDSIQQQLAKSAEDTSKVLLLHRLAYHRYWLDTSAAHDDVSRASVLSNKLNYTRGHARSFLMWGNSLSMENGMKKL